MRTPRSEALSYMKPGKSNQMHDIEEVIAGGMCVGCGACSVATSGAISVTIGTRQSFEASLNGVSPENVRIGSRVCPFSDESKNEDELAEQIFPQDSLNDERLGKFRSIFAGRRAEVDELIGSSSGGLTSWVASQLLEKGYVDGVIHMGPDGESSEMFGYQVSYSTDEIAAKRKSTYYASTFTDAVSAIRGDGKRYAFVGVPCFVRAARLLCDDDLVLKSQLLFFLGLVCGHLKSFGFAESLAWQVGVKPEELETVDFRVKVPERKSIDYDFGARAEGGHELLREPTKSLVGGNWGHAMFQLNACNYCDDIFAETADVSFGDAWLPQYKKDWRGTNVIVSRNEVIDGLILEGATQGQIEVETLSAKDAADSQAGNFRHRRDGLSLRLADDIAAGKSVPRKRVAPGSAAMSSGRKKIIRQRRKMSIESQTLFTEAKQRGSLQIFLDGMAPLVAAYQRAERQSVPLRTKLERRLRSIIHKMRNR
jgi:coenzyme F420 hydrogenase subunit beta